MSKKDFWHKKKKQMNSFSTLSTWNSDVQPPAISHIVQMLSAFIEKSKLD